MKISEVVSLLNAKVHCGGDQLDREVHSACGCDLMSDVLAYIKDQSMLLTGLVNPQVIRTAEMMDMSCVILVRGKQPTEEIVELAEEKDIILLSTPIKMFSACGILYHSGLMDGGEC